MREEKRAARHKTSMPGACTAWLPGESQFTLPRGRCYLSPILDMNTDEVISYNLSLSPNMEQIKDMLRKEYTSFEILSKAIADYIDYCNNRRIQANKMDASRKIPGSIHDAKLIVQFK